jgi:sulfonate transport system substrate-binding protein
LLYHRHQRVATRRYRVVARRALATVGALATTATLAAGVAASPASAASRSASLPKVPAGVTLRVADQLNSVQNLLADAGEDKSYTYKVDYSEFVGGPPMLQAFQAGSLDVGFVADTPIIFAQAAGQDLTTVAAWGPVHGSDALVSAPGVKVSGWKSLKGKKVAYQVGTVEEAVVLEGLRSVGLTLSDISTVNLATTSITPALENGSVSAGILVQPLTAAYLNANPTAKQVLVGNDVTARVSSLISSRTALANAGTKAAMANFIARLEGAYKWVNSHPAQYAQDLYVTQYKVPLAEGEQLLAAAGPVSFLTLPGSLLGPQQVLANLYQSAGEIPTKVNVKSELNGAFNSVVKANA